MAIGGVFARWASAAAVTELSTFINPIALDLPLDWRVFAFTAAVLVATVMLFGVTPALWTTHVQPFDALKAHGRSATSAGLPRQRRRPDRRAGRAVAGARHRRRACCSGHSSRCREAPLGFDKTDVLAITLSAPTVPAPARNAAYHQFVKAAAKRARSGARTAVRCRRRWCPSSPIRSW